MSDIDSVPGTHLLSVMPRHCELLGRGQSEPDTRSVDAKRYCR